MASSITDILAALALAGLAGWGGGNIVYGEYDDSPGMMVIGLVAILASAALTVWMARRARMGVDPLA